jgi:hypothetical protein
LTVVGLTELRLSVPEAGKRLKKDRERRGFTMGQVAWQTWDRICELYGWPQTFVRSKARIC